MVQQNMDQDLRVRWDKFVRYPNVVRYSVECFDLHQGLRNLS